MPHLLTYSNILINCDVRVYPLIFQNRRVKNKSNKRAEKGQAIIEMIFSIIMFAIMLSSVTAMSAYLYVQHATITAAREGARIAALNSDLGSAANVGVGEAAVEDFVIDMMASASGITISSADVTVTAPDALDPVGDRSVQIDIDYELTNPIPVGSILTALTGNSYGFDTIPIHSEATMHYEE